MRGLWTRIGLSAGVGAAALMAASGAFAASCSDMAGLKLKDVTIVSATEVSGSFTPGPTMFRTLGGAPKSITGLPEFCRVAALIKPTSDSEIRAEVWLPKDWNGKYDGVGNMGQGGTLLYDAMVPALKRGYATSLTDTGHNRDANPFDASWAKGHPEKIIDFGYRSTHLTAVLAKAVITAFYGARPQYSYFEGCSQGGQEALMEAQRFPDDYDGIIAGNADYAFTHHFIGGHLWVPYVLYHDDPNFIFAASKSKALGDAINAACDLNDGVKDGVVENPLACKFDPATIQCATGDGPSCLTAKEVGMVRKFEQEGVDPLVSPGFYGRYPPAGSEGATWAGFIAGVPLANKETFYLGNAHMFQATPMFANFVYGDANWDWRGWDWAKDPARVLNTKVGAQTLTQVMDANSADLSRFAARKGKLIQYHGWGDPNVAPTTAVNYHARVQANLKGATDATYRLFMVPGMGHCQGGPGPDKFDMLTAMENWAEHGQAPAQIPAAHMTAGKADRSRILCPYPQAARYDGKGDPNDAKSFRCAKT